MLREAARHGQGGSASMNMGTGMAMTMHMQRGMPMIMGLSALGAGNGCCGVG